MKEDVKNAIRFLWEHHRGKFVGTLLGLLFALICGALSIGLGILLFDTLNGSIPMVKEEVLEESVLYTNLRAVAYAIFPYMKSLMFKQ